jgi:hypothetical protein
MNRLSTALGFALAMVPVASSFAVVTSGTGGKGVVVGSSSLISSLDYADTFTGTPDGGAPARPYVAALQATLAYNVERDFGNPSRRMTGGYSFASDGVGNPGFVDGVPAYPGNPIANDNTSGSGSGTGFSQTGGGVDYGLAYGLRSQYIVQVDAVQVADRIDITTGPQKGTIFAANSLSVFFRRSGSSNEIGLFNGTTETPTGLTTGTLTGQWNNYAVKFDQVNKTVEVFVNEVSRGKLDLTTFAGGIYQNFSNAAVGAGAGLAGGENRTWTDNLQVGGTSALVQSPGPKSLQSFWNFNESNSGTGTAFDQRSTNNGNFQGGATRTTGLVGAGGAQFFQVASNAVNVGNGGLNDSFAFSKGITIEAVFATNWNGATEAEIFRKEDGNNRILLSFQGGGNINNNFGQLVGTAGVPGLSLGLNANAYGELDVAFDGLGGRPTLAQVADGKLHHVMATFDAVTGLKSIYLDGNLIAQLDIGNDMTLITGGGAAAFIGSSGGGGEPFTGIIDEVAIYGQALTAADAQAHFALASVGRSYFDIPEPGTLSLLGLAGLALLRRRRVA